MYLYMFVVEDVNHPECKASPWAKHLCRLYLGFDQQIGDGFEHEKLPRVCGPYFHRGTLAKKFRWYFLSFEFSVPPQKKPTHSIGACPRPPGFGTQNISCGFILSIYLFEGKIEPFPPGAWNYGMPWGSRSAGCFCGSFGLCRCQKTPALHGPLAPSLRAVPTWSALLYKSALPLPIFWETRRKPPIPPLPRRQL
jgi:hypothetical protein